MDALWSKLLKRLFPQLSSRRRERLSDKGNNRIARPRTRMDVEQLEDRVVPAGFGLAGVGGGLGNDEGRDVAVDAAGNIYVTGTFSGPADFDLGGGSTTLTSKGGRDVFVAKYDSALVLQWARQLGGTNDESVAGVAVDANGNVYTAGVFRNAADFNPSEAESYEIDLGNSPNVFVSKLNANGNFVWAQAFGGGNPEDCLGITVDTAGNVYTTGTFNATVDFNPGEGDFLVTSPQKAAFVHKLNSAGVFSWVSTFVSTEDVASEAIAVDGAGYVYTAGSFRNSLDLNPGEGTDNKFAVSGNDVFVSKLDPDGAFVWGRAFGGSGNDRALGLAVDSLGNVFTTGAYEFTVDFDPSIERSFTLPGSVNGDIFVSKLDALGHFAWARSAGANGQIDLGTSVAVDGAGNVFVIGAAHHSSDFDSGPGVYPLTDKHLNTDIFVSKFSGAGTVLWARALGGTEDNERGNAIATDTTGKVFTTGYSSGSADFDPTAATLIPSHLGGKDYFVSVLLPAEVVGRVWMDADADGIQDEEEANVANATVELFNAVDNVVGNGNDILLDERTTGADGSYRFLDPGDGANRYVRIKPPPGTSGSNPPYLSFASASQGTNPALDSDVNSGGVSPLFSLEVGQSKDLDAGLKTYTPAFAAWAAGGNGADAGQAATTDADGNVYVTGKFQGTVDFDPGAGVTERIASATDAFVAKYSTSGALLWVRQLGGAGDDQGLAITVVGGHVFVTGTFEGNAGFGPGSTTLDSQGATDVFVLKLTTTGAFGWVGQLGGTGADSASGIGVDSQGNVFTTGLFEGLADFNPGAGNAPLTSVGASDVFVSKLDSMGGFLAAKQFGGNAAVSVTGLAIGSGESVHLTGSFQGTADFSTGGASEQRTSTGSDAYVLKLNNSGSLVWVRLLGRLGDDFGQAVDVDSLGNVFTAGTFQGTVDFNPDSQATNNLDSVGGSSDVFVSKLDADGFYLGAWSLGGTSAETAAGIAVGADGFLHVTGTFQGSADFDPDLLATFSLTSFGAADVFTAKLTPAGALVYARQLGGSAADSAGAVAVDGAGNVFTTGSFQSTADLDPGVGYFLLGSNGGSDAFVSRFTPFVVEGSVWYDLDGDGVRAAGDPALPNTTVQLFDAVDGVVGNGNDVALAAVQTDGAGGYRFVDPRETTGYYVRVTIPQGTTSGNNLPLLAFTQPGQGINTALDSDVNALGVSALVSSTLGERVTLDAGLKEIVLNAGAWGLGAAGEQFGRAVAVDAAGNVYVAGTFEGTVDFDPRPGETLLTAVAKDGFVARYSAAGVLQWVRRLGGSGDDQANGVAVDATGVYLTGLFRNTVDFGDGNRTATGADAFVLKLTPAGNFAWVRQLGAAGADAGHAVAAGADGTVTVTGSLTSTFDFNPGSGTFAPAASGDADVFVTRYASNGDYLWAYRAGGGEIDEGRGVAVDDAGNSYVTGSFQGTINFPNGVSLDSGGNFLLKLDEDGGFVRRRRLAGSNTNYAIAAAANGDVYTTGFFSGTVNFGPGPENAEFTSFSGSSDVVVNKFDADFSLQWARQLGGAGADEGRGIAVDSAGNVYITGTFSGNNADFNPAPGASALLNSAGGTDVFLTRLDAGGNFVLARRLGGQQDEVSNGVAVDASGTLWTTGSFRDTADFDPGTGTFALTSLGGGDAFVAKLDQGIIQGRVWLDLDADGVQDAQEPGLEGAAIEVFRSTDGVIGNADDVSVGVAVSQGDGSYRFTGAGEGTGFYVRVRPPAGTSAGSAHLVFTTANQGAEATDSDVGAAGVSALFALDTTGPATLDAGLQGTIPPLGLAWTPTGTGESNVQGSHVDAAGNVYLTGSFKGTVDFDPGPGTVTLTSTNGGDDAFVARYTAGGALAWVRQFGGTAVEEAGLAVTVDSLGNVYTTGSFRGTVDFNPGSESFPLSSSQPGTDDVFVSKLDAAGRFSAAWQLGGSGDDVGRAIVVDGAGNVVVAGSFQGTADFDPGAGSATLTSLGTQDAFVVKLSAAGAPVWVRQAGGDGARADTAGGVAVDASGAVYVAGAFFGTADFDPSPGVEDRRSAGLRDVFAWKLTAAGDLAWVRTAGGTGDDVATALVLDAAGNVYLTGSFTGIADFNPGSGFHELSSFGGTDAFLWRLGGGGTFDGVAAPPLALGGDGLDVGNAVAVNASGIYLAGTFQGTADFDPGAGVLALTSVDGSDAFVVHLDLQGNRRLARRLGGPSNDEGRGVGHFADQVFFTGSIIGTATFDAGAGAQNLGGTAPRTGFVARLNQAPPSGAFPLDVFEPNSELVPVNLGVVNNGQQTLDNLTLHTAGDEDWFRFDLVTATTGAHSARIDFQNAQGNLDLELYRNGQLVASSTGTGDGEEISLAGRGIGTYFVRVLGQANPDYSFTLTVPRALTPDAREGNDEPETPTALGTLNALTVVENLSIHTEGNADWFRFTTLAAGTPNAQVRIAFRHGQGDLDLELYDSDGVTLLRQSGGASDTEVVSLAGLSAGGYLVKVIGHNNALNPNYTLSINPPRQLLPDRLEPNELGNPRVLGTVDGTRVETALSIHTPTDEDWFSFTTVATAAVGHEVRIDFKHTDGDLDLELWNATQMLASSRGGTDVETISLATREAGTYFVKVSGFEGALQSSYDLKIVAPTSALLADRLEGLTGNNSTAEDSATRVRTEGGTKLVGTQTLVDLTLHNPSDEDYFRFETDAPGGAGHRLVLSYAAADGEVGLELLSSAGNHLLTGTGSGTKSVSLDGLQQGVYFARVFNPAGEDGNRYTLSFDAPTPSNTAADWTIMVYMTADNLVNRAFNDINEMEVAASLLPGTVNFAVFWDQSSTLRTFATGNGAQAAWGTAGRALIVPDTDLTQIATTFEVSPDEQDSGQASTLSDFMDWARGAAPANNYALVLWDHGGGLRGFNFDRRDGAGSSQLTSAELKSALTGRPVDLLAFDSCFMALTEGAFDLQGLASVMVGSQDVIPGDGFEYDQAFMSLASNPGDVEAEALAAGMVQSYAARYGSSGLGDTLSAVRTAALANLATALDAFRDAVNAATPAHINVLNALAVNTLIPSELASEQRDLGDFMRAVEFHPDLSLALKNAASAVGDRLDEAVISRTADPRGSSGLSIYLPVAESSLEEGVFGVTPGAFSTYASEFSTFITQTGWFEVLTRLEEGADSRNEFLDSYDTAKKNDVSSAASDLKSLAGPGHVYDSLSLHEAADRDWYRFDVNAGPDSSLEVVVEVVSGPGSLIAQLYAAGDRGPESLPRDAATTSTGATLALGDLLGGGLAGLRTFYLRFLTQTGEVARYRFTVSVTAVSAPQNTATDWAGANSTQEKAYTLNTRAGTSHSGLTLGGNAQDWFRFDTPPLPNLVPREILLATSGTQTVARLLDASDNLVSIAQGTGNLRLLYLESGAAESYKLVVSNQTSTAVPYRMTFETRDPSEDFLPPTSSVSPLPARVPANFAVNWSGSDPSGIAGYDIFVSDNGGTFTPWLTGTTQTSAVFTGVDGHTYAFYSVATDVVGNRQRPPFSQASTRVDGVRPTSSVSALPVRVPASFTVNWSGSDPSGGSGIAGYDIYVSDNGGTFTPWLTGTTQTSAVFTGVDDHTYAFYSVATDAAGNRQEPPYIPASIRVDGVAPTSSVSPLPDRVSANFTVSWSGNDPSGGSGFAGSGIAGYDIYVSDGGEFTRWLTGTTQTSAVYAGVDGHTYAFYSVATDVVGNRQATPPPDAQKSATVVATPVNVLRLAPPINIAKKGTVTFSAATPNALSVQGAADSTITVVLHASSGTLTATAVGGAVPTGNGSGTLTIVGSLDDVNATLDGLVYRAANLFRGVVRLTMTTQQSSSSSGLTDVDTLPIGVANRRPSTTPGGLPGVFSYSTRQNLTLNVAVNKGVVRGKRDVDGDVLEAIELTPPTLVGLTLDSDGSFRYTPPANFTGIVKFKFRYFDGLTYSNLVTVKIKIKL